MRSRGSVTIALLSRPAQRKRYFDFSSATDASPHVKVASAVGIQTGDTLSGHGQPKARRGLQRPAGRQSYTVIQYADVETVIGLLCQDDDGASRGSLGNSVTNGIFHQRLNK